MVKKKNKCKKCEEKLETLKSAEKNIQALASEYRFRYSTFSKVESNLKSEILEERRNHNSSVAEVIKKEQLLKEANKKIEEWETTRCELREKLAKLEIDYKFLECENRGWMKTCQDQKYELVFKEELYRIALDQLKYYILKEKEGMV